MCISDRSSWWDHQVNSSCHLPSLLPCLPLAVRQWPPANGQTTNGQQPPATAILHLLFFFFCFFPMGISSVFVLIALHRILQQFRAREAECLSVKFSTRELGTYSSHTTGAEASILHSPFVLLHPPVVLRHPPFRSSSSCSVLLSSSASVVFSTPDLQMISQPVGSRSSYLPLFFSTVTIVISSTFAPNESSVVIPHLLLVRPFVINPENSFRSSLPSGQLLCELLPGLSEAGLRTPMPSTVYLKQPQL